MYGHFVWACPVLVDTSIADRTVQLVMEQTKVVLDWTHADCCKVAGMLFGRLVLATGLLPECGATSALAHAGSAFRA